MFRDDDDIDRLPAGERRGSGAPFDGSSKQTMKLATPPQAYSSTRSCSMILFSSLTVHGCSIRRMSVCEAHSTRRAAR